MEAALKSQNNLRLSHQQLNIGYYFLKQNPFKISSTLYKIEEILVVCPFKIRKILTFFINYHFYSIPVSTSLSSTIQYAILHIPHVRFINMR